jgi:hypothetical protein
LQNGSVQGEAADVMCPLYVAGLIGPGQSPLKARFAAVRVRVADEPPQRIGDNGMQHMPGDEVWLVGEGRASGQQKYYLANLPTDTGLKTLAATIKALGLRAGSPAARVRTRPRPLRRPLMARLHPMRRHDHLLQRLRLAAASG